MTRISPENGREVSLCAVNGQTPAEVAWRFFEEHATGPARITVTVTGLRGGDRGTVAASLYAGPEGFPDDAEKALAQKESPVADGRAVLTFEDVPAPGAFAVVILHDENGNGKMDTAFGLPSEGYGASNNPKARFGPPRYNDARFTIRGRGAVHAVAVKALYLTGGGG